MGHILVIDDDASVRDTFALTLEACGHSVTTVSGGMAGLNAARAAEPDLVFLDLKMPGMSGVETLRGLHGICPATPVYIVTAFYEEFMSPLRELQGEGISFDIARKPLGLAEIRTIADAMLAARKRRAPVIVAESAS
jgi:CheY-like chemotaxis protein